MEGRTQNSYMYDVIILGGGPAGTHAASLLAAAGKRVALIEKNRLGGCCVHTGCIPTKLLIEDAKRGNFRWKDFQNRLQEITTSNEEGMRLVLLSRGVKIYEGEARVMSEHTVQISSSGHTSLELSGAQILCCTGAESRIPEAWRGVPNLETTDSFWFREELPKRMAIVGGGIAGCELAGALKDLVEELVLIEQEDEILPGFSAKAREVVMEHLAMSDVRILTGCSGPGDALETDAPFECILMAAGRKAEDVPEGSVPLGDARGGIMNAYMAKAEAERWTARYLNEGESEPLTEAESGICPVCVFSDPQIARVGMSKAQAIACGRKAVEGKAPFYVLGMAKILGCSDGFISLVRDRETDRLLGAEIVGGDACELIHLLLPYMVHQIPCSEMRKVVFAHPTFAEGVHIALEETYEGSVELPKRRGRRQ